MLILTLTELGSMLAIGCVAGVASGGGRAALLTRDHGSDRLQLVSDTALYLGGPYRAAPVAVGLAIHRCFDREPVPCSR